MGFPRSWSRSGVKRHRFWLGSNFLLVRLVKIHKKRRHNWNWSLLCRIHVQSLVQSKLGFSFDMSEQRKSFGGNEEYQAGWRGNMRIHQLPTDARCTTKWAYVWLELCLHVSEVCILPQTWEFLKFSKNNNFLKVQRGKRRGRCRYKPGVWKLHEGVWRPVRIGD